MGCQVFFSLQSAGSIPLGTTLPHSLCSFLIPPTPHSSHRSILLKPSSYEWRGGANARETETADLPLGAGLIGCNWTQAVTALQSAKLHLHLRGNVGCVVLSYFRNGGFQAKCCGDCAGAL